MYKQLIAALSLPALALSAPTNYTTACTKTCVVDSCEGRDTSQAIIEAFKECGHETGDNRGKVIFKNETYNVEKVMNTTGLTNVDVEIYGTLLWDTNITYWTSSSLPVGYQNQSSAWLFGGDQIHFTGFGYGTLDGNGQEWYEWAQGINK